MLTHIFPKIIIYKINIKLRNARDASVRLGLLLHLVKVEAGKQLLARVVQSYGRRLPSKARRLLFAPSGDGVARTQPKVI